MPIGQPGRRRGRSAGGGGNDFGLELPSEISVSDRDPGTPAPHPSPYNRTPGVAERQRGSAGTLSGRNAATERYLPALSFGSGRVPADRDGQRGVSAKKGFPGLSSGTLQMLSAWDY